MIIPEDFAQVNFRFLGEGLPHGGEVTLGIGLSDPLLTPADVGEAVGGIFVSDILGHLGSDVVLSEVLVKFGPNDDGPSDVVSIGEAGGSAVAGASPAVTYLVRKATALGGRKHRGRWYLPGVTEGSITNAGVVDPTKVDNMNASLVTFLADLETANCQAFLLHANLRDPETGEELPGTAADPDPITSLSMQSVVATQRRRQRS